MFLSLRSPQIFACVAQSSGMWSIKTWIQINKFVNNRLCVLPSTLTLPQPSLPEIFVQESWPKSATLSDKERHNTMKKDIEIERSTQERTNCWGYIKVRANYHLSSPYLPGRKFDQLSRNFTFILYIVSVASSCQPPVIGSFFLSYHFPHFLKSR